MKDYQLYLEKIVNALSRAGISYPVPSFTTYEGMWSYVEGLGSFLEMNAQLQKSGAGVVLMGLEESTTFKTYWNSEFYQEFQERKLLESKISSENEDSDYQEDYAESLVTQEAENITETASSEDHLTEVVSGVATVLVVGSVASSSNGLDMSNVIFSDDDDEDEEDSDYDEESTIEEGDFDLDEEEEVSNSDLGSSGFDMSNVVFSDDEDDEEEDDFEEDDLEEYSSNDDKIEEEEFYEDSNSSKDSLHGVSKEELTGYDFSNVIFSDDDDDEEESLSDSEEEYEYDEDGFIIDNSEPKEDDEEDDFIEEEDEYEYDEDGFIIDRSEPEEDDDEEEFFDEEEDEYEYDEDGFIIDRSEPEEDDEEEDEFFEDTSDGYTYDEDGFVIEDDEPIIEDEDEDFEEDGDDFEDNVVPIKPHQVNPPRETVPKPKPVRPKELQETDKILSIFGSLEGKLRKKVKDVKDKSKN